MSTVPARSSSKLIFSALMSLDGYASDVDGNFAWAAPDDDVHAVVNDLERPIGTYLYGRRMYEVMVAWENADSFVGDSAVMQDYARIWRAADKIVYSTTLDSPSSEKTRIEHSFDAHAVKELKSAASADLSIGGPTLAAQAFAAGLIDEVHLFISPVIVGGGTRALPDGLRVTLELVGEHRFDGGTVHLHYTVHP